MEGDDGDPGTILCGRRNPVLPVASQDVLWNLSECLLMPNEFNPTGTWVGEYHQHDRPYRGNSYGDFRVGDRVVGQEIENDAVQYSGRVGPGGEEIEGRWWIDPPPGTEGGQIEGSFELRRRRADAEALREAALITERGLGDPSAGL